MFNLKPGFPNVLFLKMRRRRDRQVFILGMMAGGAAVSVVSMIASRIRCKKCIRCDLEEQK